MRPHSFVPIGRVIPWRIGARYRSSKLITRRVGENFSRRMDRNSRPRWLSLPVDPQSRVVDIHGVIERAGVSEGWPPFLCRERNDLWKRKVDKHSRRHQRAENSGANRSSGDAAETQCTEQKNEGQGKHRRLRQVAETEQYAKPRKHQPGALSAPDAKQQRRGEVHERGNAKIRRHPRGAQPKVTRPQEKNVPPNPYGLRRNGQGFLLRLAGSFPQQNQFFQKQLKGGEARGIQTKIQEMRYGKL